MTNASNGDEILSRISSLSPEYWPSRLAEFVDVIASFLCRKRRHTQASAHMEATRLVLALAKVLGGEIIYLPKGDRLEIALHFEFDSYFNDPNLQHPNARRSRAWHVQLRRLVQSLLCYYQAKGLIAEKASIETQAIIEELSLYIGGRATYIPKGEDLYVAARYVEIAQKHNTGKISVRELAAEYGISQIHIYKVLSVQKSRDRKNRSALSWGEVAKKNVFGQ